MDQELLVEEFKEDGEDLLARLVDGGFDVTVAFWAKVSDGGMWYLYIVTKSLDSPPPVGTWRSIYDAMQQVGPSSITFINIKLIPPSDPIALAALDACRGGSGRAIRHRGPMLGDLAIDKAYIYPRTSDPLDRVAVVHRLAREMAEAGPSGPPLIILKDGSRLRATPIEIRKTGTGIDITLHDADSGVDRSISADDVAAIQAGSRTPRLVQVVGG